MLNVIETLKKSIVIASLSLLATSAFAQKVSLPQSLTEKEISPEISRSLKSALSDMSMPCGLEGAHAEHDHAQPVRRALTQRDSALTTDSARKLVFSDEALSQHQITTLIESLGELNPESTDALLRSVYNYAEVLASRIMDGDIEDKEMAQRVYNSHVTDIRSAVMRAVAENKSRKMLDIVETAAKGEGVVAESATTILHNRKLK